MSEKQIKGLLHDLDKDNDGTIDVDEFLQVIGSGAKREVIHKALQKRAVVRKRFEKYDKDGDGTISKAEFKKVVEDKFSSRLTSEEIAKLMKDADRDGDGQIDYEEFLKAFSYFPAK